MTTAKLPWTLEYVSDALTRIKDASGNCIAEFNTYHNAELVIEKWQLAQEELEEANAKLDEVQNVINGEG